MTFSFSIKHAGQKTLHIYPIVLYMISLIFSIKSPYFSIDILIQRDIETQRKAIWFLFSSNEYRKQSVKLDYSIHTKFYLFIYMVLKVSIAEHCERIPAVDDIPTLVSAMEENTSCCEYNTVLLAEKRRISVLCFDE